MAFIDWYEQIVNVPKGVKKKGIIHKATYTDTVTFGKQGPPSNIRDRPFEIRRGGWDFSSRQVIFFLYFCTTCYFFKSTLQQAFFEKITHWNQKNVNMLGCYVVLHVYTQYINIATLG